MWAGYWAARLLQMSRAGINVTSRPLRYRRREVPGRDGVPEIISVPQEKGIDTRMVVDILSTARTRQWNVAVIYSQDQDLAEVVDEVRAIAKEQDRWVHFCCAFPSGPNATAGRGIDNTQWFRMERDFYDACLDPTDYRPKRS